MLIEAAAASHVQAMFPRRHGADRDQPQRQVSGQLHFLEKRAARSGLGARRLGRPRMLVAEPGRPVRGRNDRAVVGDEIEEVERLSGRHRRRFAHVRHEVRLRLSDSAGHSQNHVARGDPLDARRDLFALAANSRRICATTAAARCASTAANARRALDDTVDVTSTTVSATAALTSAKMPVAKRHVSSVVRDVPVHAHGAPVEP